MEMRNLHKQKKESQDYATNASYMISLLTFMERNVRRNLIFEEHIESISICAHTTY